MSEEWGETGWKSLAVIVSATGIDTHTEALAIARLVGSKPFILVTSASHMPRAVELFRRASYFVDRILRGTKVSELPVELPTKLELVINLKTAKAIGLVIPESFLLRADELIE